MTTASQSAELNRVADQTIDGVTYQIVTYKDAGQTVELQINSSTHLPARVAYMEDDALLGDTRNEWVWSDWRDVGGVRLPHSEEHQLNGLLIRKETNTDIQNNPAIASNTFAIAEQARKEPEVGDRIVSEWTWRRAVMGVGFQDFVRPQNVELEELAPGVFYARGGTHHSMIVEMKDHLMVFEAPLFEERGDHFCQRSRVAGAGHAGGPVECERSCLLHGCQGAWTQGGPDCRRPWNRWSLP